MLRYFFSILFILNLSFIGISQENSKIKVGIKLSPMLTYRALATPYSDFQWFINYRDSLEKSSFGLTGGIFMEYYFGKKTSLSFGINYNKYSYKQKEQNLPENFADFSVNKTSIKTTFYFISTPLIFNYSLQQNKFSYEVSAGLSFNINTENLQTHYFYNNSDIMYKEYRSGILDSRKIFISAIMSFKIEYKLSEKISIGISPELSHSLTSIYSDSDIKEYIYSCGIQTSFSKKF